MPLIEEYLAQLNSSLVALKDSLRTSFPSPEAAEDARRKAILKRLSSGDSDYDVISQALDTARTNFEVVVVGEELDFYTDGMLTGITVRLNNPTAPAIPLNAFRNPKALFGKIYLTWTAQTGRTLYIFVGRNSASTSSGTIVGESYSLPLNLFVVLDSTTSPLGDGATYTSARYWAANYGWIIGTCFANRAGTLYIDQSNDGTNYDSVTSFAYTANDTMGFKVAVVGIYFRVRFTNSAGAAQTTFRLYTNVRSM